MSKRSIPGYKDDNGIFVKEPGIIAPAPKKRRNREPKSSDISLNELMDKYLLLLFRETKRLLEESASAKLNKDSALCMRENLKLIVELKKKEKELLDTLSEEELNALVNK